MSGFPKIRRPHHNDHIHISGSVIDPSASLPGFRQKILLLHILLPAMRLPASKPDTAVQL